MSPALARFLVIGAVLFAADRALTPPGVGGAAAPAAAEAAVPVAADDGLPGDDPLLVDAALALGLHREDPVVARRLAFSLAALAPDGEAGRDGDRVREAEALGLHARDPLVRRRLAAQLRLRAAAAARSAEPAEAELAQHLARHAGRFGVPEMRGLRLVSLARERGEGLAAETERLGAALRAGARPEDGAAGDALPPLPDRFDATSERALAAVAGETLARAAFAAPPGTWTGPVPSPLGVHFVRVETTLPARPARLDEVRAAVREGVLAEREAAALEAMRAALRAGAERHAGAGSEAEAGAGADAGASAHAVAGGDAGGGASAHAGAGAEAGAGAAPGAER